jgi:hypothetical protein
MRDVRPLSEELKSLGFTESTPGGDLKLEGMARLMGAEIVVPTPAAPEQVTEGAEPGATTEGEDPFEGSVLSEELLERMEALDYEAADPDTLDELLAAIGDKQVPEALEARLAAVLDEMKKIRISAGKITRVNVRRGSKAMKAKRKARLEYKRHRAKIKIGRKKRMRKAGAKIKARKTARKRKSLFGKLKGLVRKAGKKLGGLVKKVKGKMGLSGGLGKSESKLARELEALLAESRSGEAGLRDEMVARIGDCLVLLDWIIGDEDVTECFCEAYEPIVESYCGDALTEARVDDAAFVARIAPVTRLIGKCVSELQGNLERPE